MRAYQLQSGSMVGGDHYFDILKTDSLAGGGFFDGGTPDLRYNLSFIVQNSIKIGKPIMAASIAYRLGPFGFLNGNDVARAGVTNLGLKDQRLALHWIQENIAGFGGTWNESVR
jgi:carboxylesterase type B